MKVERAGELVSQSYGEKEDDPTAEQVDKVFASGGYRFRRFLVDDEWIGSDS